MTSILQSKYRVAFMAGALGLCISLLCYGIAYFNNDVSDWMFVVWPSMIMLLAIFHPGVAAIMGVTISIVVNVALYALVGHLLAMTLAAIARMPKRRI